MHPDLFSPDTVEFIKLLNKYNVNYVLVGGIAVVYHGYIRGTGDVDFFYQNTPANIDRLSAALEDFWEGHLPQEVSKERLAAEEAVIQFGVPPYRIDLINSIEGVDFVEVKNNVVVEKLEIEPPIEVPIIHINQLLKNKKAAARPKDQQDLRYLRNEQEEN